MIHLNQVLVCACPNLKWFDRARPNLKWFDRARPNLK